MFNHNSNANKNRDVFLSFGTTNENDEQEHAVEFTGNDVKEFVKKVFKKIKKACKKIKEKIQEKLEDSSEEMSDSGSSSTIS